MSLYFALIPRNLLAESLINRGIDEKYNKHYVK